MEKAEDITAVELMEREDGTGEVDDEARVRANGDSICEAEERGGGGVILLECCGIVDGCSYGRCWTLWTFFFLQYVRAALMDDYGAY